MNLKEKYGRLWTGLFCMREGACGGLFKYGNEPLGFNKIIGISS
jgi:hypothetical protein